MTTTHTRFGLDRPPTLSQRGRPVTARPDDRDAHLLRLVLDLQLDALMLAIGAAAVEETQPPSAADPVTQGGVPWARWVGEDVDLTRELAAEAITGGAALPAVLGSETPAPDRQVVLDRLAARYEGMRELLRDLLARTSGPTMRPGRGEPTGGAAGAEDQVIDLAEPAHLRRVLARCQTRLMELQGLLDRTVPPQPIRAVPDRPYLPGELLG